jgi:hypothetical protein
VQLLQFAVQRGNLLLSFAAFGLGFLKLTFCLSAPQQQSGR